MTGGATRRALLALAAAAVLAVPVAAQEDGPVYLIASLAVSDLEAYFASYGGPVFPMLAAAGAEVLVGTPAPEVLEGSYGASWTAIVRFPSQAALEAWYGSVEYQTIAPARRALSDPDASVLLSAPAFRGPPG